MTDYKTTRNGIWISRDELEHLKKNMLQAFKCAEEVLPQNCYEASGKAYFCQDLINLIDRENDSIAKHEQISYIPFDITKAREGMKAQTKSGKKVRILCYDKKGLYPVLGLVGEDESINSWTKEGHLYAHNKSEGDLVLVREETDEVDNHENFKRTLHALLTCRTRLTNDEILCFLDSHCNEILNLAREEFLREEMNFEKRENVNLASIDYFCRWKSKQKGSPSKVDCFIEGIKYEKNRKK